MFQQSNRGYADMCRLFEMLEQMLEQREKRKNKTLNLSLQPSPLLPEANRETDEVASSLPKAPIAMPKFQTARLPA